MPLAAVGCLFLIPLTERSTISLTQTMSETQKQPLILDKGGGVTLKPRQYRQLHGTEVKAEVKTES